MKHHRGQGLSLTTIVVAAVSLIVLVVLVAIFTQRIGIFGEGVRTATASESACRTQCGSFNQEGKLSDSCGLDETEIPGTFFDRSQDKVLCCCSRPARRV